eukprot:126355-Chlamydomonas_euryale.AAC.9
MQSAFSHQSHRGRGLARAMRVCSACKEAKPKAASSTAMVNAKPAWRGGAAAAWRPPHVEGANLPPVGELTGCCESQHVHRQHRPQVQHCLPCRQMHLAPLSRFHYVRPTLLHLLASLNLMQHSKDPLWLQEAVS